MKNLIVRFVREEEAQDLIEYALVASFVSLAVVTGAQVLATALNGWYGRMGTAVDGMQPGGGS
jgi:Flp pilus assembly pilin Flp